MVLAVEKTSIELLILVDPPTILLGLLTVEIIFC